MATIKLAREVRSHHGTARTVLSAEREIIAAFVDIRWYGIEHPSINQWVEIIDVMSDAISEVTGTSKADIVTGLDARIERSFAAQVKASDKHWGALRAAQPHLDAHMSEQEEATRPQRNY